MANSDSEKETMVDDKKCVSYVVPAKPLFV